MKKRQRGFTLIEILIVVVIMAVLAALILPRMFSQPEKAIVAEANQLLGTMSNGQMASLDAGGAYVVIVAADAGNATVWNRLGIVPPGAAVVAGPGPKFTYTCAAGTLTCTATRTAGATAPFGGSTVTATVPAAGGNGTIIWACTGGYGALANGGCTVT